MKIKHINLAILLLVSSIGRTQISIGTPTPDTSSILELKSNAKGFLPPRMTTGERNLITPAATGLLIYNTETAAFNYFDGTAWKDIAPASTGLGANSISFSVNDSTPVETLLPSDELVPGMSITPGAGKYLVSFNGIYDSPIFKNDVDITAQSAFDLIELHANLKSRTTTATVHVSPIFGNNEVLVPGAYSVLAASSLAGILYLKGNVDSVFIFDLDAAFTSAAGASVVLSGGAQASNVFWLVKDAIALGANTIMKGNLFSQQGAVSMEDGSILDGRMLTSKGAITFKKATITIPTGLSTIDVGLLSSFALFTSKGEIAAEATTVSTVTGDIGSDDGLISGFIPEPSQNSTLIGNKYGPKTIVTIDKNVLSTFSVFENGVLIPNSNRTRRSRTPTTDITLQAVATVLDGEPIEVRWKTDVSVLKMTNRILTVVKTQ